MTERGADTVTDPLRIAIVQHDIWSTAPNVVAHQALGVAEELARGGHAVTLFSPHPFCGAAPFRHVSVHLEGRATAWRWIMFMRRIDVNEFDVLHVIGDNAWPFTAKRATWLRSTFRTCQSTCCSRGVRSQFRRGRRRFAEWLDEITAGTPVPISERSRACLLSHQDHVPCGVDTSGAQERPSRSSEPSILFIDSDDDADARSRIMTIFESRIRPQFPNALLWMVTSHLVSGPGVEVVTDPSPDELSDRCRRAWVLCVLSDSEQYGLDYGMALAAGTPILTLFNVAAQELLLGRFGRITDEAGVGDDLLHLLDEPTERAALSDAAVERAEELSWRQITAQYLEIYRGRISATPPPVHLKNAGAILVRPLVQLVKAIARGVENTGGARFQDAVWKVQLAAKREALSWSIRDRCVPVELEKIYMGGIRGFTSAELAEAREDPDLPTRRVMDSDIYRRFAANEPIPRSGENLLDIPDVRAALAFTRNVRGEHDDAVLNRIREIYEFRRRRFDAGLDRIDERGPRPLIRRFIGIDCYEAVDGHHRLSAAGARGETTVLVDITWSLAPVPPGLKESRSAERRGSSADGHEPHNSPHPGPDLTRTG